MDIMLYKYYKRIKLCFTLFLFLSLPFTLYTQTITNSNKTETYVRPTIKKDSIKSNKQSVKLLQKERQKAEKVSKKLKSKIKGPNTSLSALENDVLAKTDQRIDSLSKVLDIKKQSKVSRKTTIEKDKVADEGKQLKNKKLNKAKQETVSKLKETKEGKELQEKMDKAKVQPPDSASLLNNPKVKLANDIVHLKDVPFDTLKEELKDSVKNRAVAEAKERGTTEAMKVKEVAEGKEIFDLAKAYKADSASADKIAEDLLTNSEYGKEFGKLNGNKDGLSQAKEQADQVTKEAKVMQDQAKVLQDQEQMKKYAKEKAAKLANGELAKFAPQIQQAQQQFTQYKKKMEWVKEGSGENANSLKEEPFGKRLIYGGNFQVPELDPLSVVAAPFVGYRLNKKFTSGVSFSYKVTIGKSDLKSRRIGGDYGYRFFTDYIVIKNWFAHGEFERMCKSVKNVDKDGYHSEWESNGYIGAGRQINIVKGMKMNVMFLVNILHKDLKYFDPDAFQFRFGVSK